MTLRTWSSSPSGTWVRSTEVAMRQAPFETEARRELHRNGWSESFDKLERVLSVRS